MVGKVFMVMVLALALMSASVVAPSPQPVSVFVRNAGELSGYDVEMTNMATGDRVTLVTDTDGFAIYDWSNSAHGGSPGNSIKAVVKSCETFSQCTMVKTIEPTKANPDVGKPMVFDIDVTGAVTPACPKCETCQSHSCSCSCPSVECQNVTPNCAACDSCCQAVEVQEDTTPYDKCDSCCAEKECPQPTDNSWSGFGLGALMAFVISAVGFMGGGLKIYKKKVGGVALQHNHAGATTYHDVNTKHTNPKYRHRLFKDDPMGFAADVKKINDNGGMV